MALVRPLAGGPASSIAPDASKPTGWRSSSETPSTGIPSTESGSEDAAISVPRVPIGRAGARPVRSDRGRESTEGD